MIRRIFLLALPLACNAPAVAAPDAPTVPSAPQLTASQTEITADEVFIYSGSARLTHEETILTADEIRYDRIAKTAVARGHVILTRGTIRLLAEEIVYRTDDRTYQVLRFRVGQPPYLISGDTAAGSPEHLVLSNTRVFYGEPDSLSPTITADRIEYQPGVSVASSSAKIGIGDRTLVPLPAFDQRLDGPLRITALDLSAGYRSRLGAYVTVGAEVPVAEGINAGGEIGIFSSRGLLLGPSATYNTFDPAGTGMSGRLRTGYIHDYGDTDLDILGNPVSEDRGYIEWIHRQTFSPGLTLNGQVNYWSDSEVVRDFHPGHFRRIQTPDTFLEGAYTADNYVVSVFLRAQPNDYHQMQQRLPEIRFDGLPIHVGGGFYHRINASVANLLEEDPTGVAPDIRSHRADAYYALSRPFSPREWLSMTPVVGGRVTYYDRATGRDNYTRTLGELGFDAEIRAAGIYSDVKSELWKVDGIRHLITPRLSYRYIPNADKGRPFIPQIDDLAFNTYLQPLGLGDRRHIDQLDATNTLRIGLDNVLQTRDPVYGSRNLLALQLAADTHFDDQPGRRSTSDIHGALTLTPAHWLQFDLYQRYTAQTGKMEEINTAITFRDADIWSLRFANHYLETSPANPTAISEYLLDYAIRLNEAYRALLRVRYDSRTRDFIEQSYALEHKLNQVWTLFYVVSLYDGPRREGDFSFSIRVQLSNF